MPAIRPCDDFSRFHRPRDATNPVVTRCHVLAIRRTCIRQRRKRGWCGGVQSFPANEDFLDAQSSPAPDGWYLPVGGRLAHRCRGRDFSRYDRWCPRSRRSVVDPAGAGAARAACKGRTAQAGCEARTAAAPETTGPAATPSCGTARSATSSACCAPSPASAATGCASSGTSARACCTTAASAASAGSRA